MKILLILVSMFMVSCTPSSGDSPKQFYEEDIESTRVFKSILHFKYNNHHYIKFNMANFKSSSDFSVVHNPDCSCLKQVK